MKVLVQRVKKASCHIDSNCISKIGKGILLFVGFDKGDTEEKVKKLAYKCANLRIFEDSKNKMNLSVKDVKGEALVISQFTLCADCKKGLRPNFENALETKAALDFYKKFVKYLNDENISVKEGVFGSYMKIYIVNDGPVTFFLSD